MITIESNHVADAIYKIGGPTKAGILLRVNSQTTHQWIRKRYVPDYDLAKKLSKASGVKLELLVPETNPRRRNHGLRIL